MRVKSMPVTVSGVEKPKPGSEGTTTSKASAGSPPWAAGSLSGPITLWKSQNVHGQPWVRISGSGSGPAPGARTKCTGTPSRSARKWASPFIARSWARQS